MKCEKESPVGKRATHKCPVAGCPTEFVIHLPRHLKQYHKWNHVKAASAISQFNLRKQRKKKGNRTYTRRVCPIQNCNAVVRRIHNHLGMQGPHKLPRDSEEYSHYLRQAAEYVELPDTFSEDVISLSSSTSSDEEIHKKSKRQREASMNRQKDAQQVKSEVESNPDIQGFSEEGMNYSPTYSQEERDHNYEENPALALLWEHTFGSSRPMDISQQNVMPDEDKDYDEMGSEGDNESVEGGNEIDGASVNYSEFSHNEMTSEENKERVDDADKNYAASVDSSEFEGAASDDSSDSDHCRNNETENVLQQFKFWLEGVDGGRREEKTAKQYVSQVRVALNAVSPTTQAISCLVMTNLVRDHWLNELEKNKRPGTCKAYLGSLSKFLRFLMLERPKGVDVDESEIRAAKEQVHEWMSSYKKPIARRMWEKKMEDFDNLISADDIRRFDVSEPSRKAVQIIEQYSRDAPSSYPTQTDYTLVRDFFLTTLCINNACRAGPLANMTLGEFRRAKKEGEQYVVRVLNHKTVDTHGPASVVVSASLYNWLVIYLSKMRNSLNGAKFDENEVVFLSWNAKPMTSSMVSAQINSFWSKALGKGAARMSATLIRKTAVSAVHEKHVDMKKGLANLMTHSQRTAEKYYNIQEKGRSDARTVEQLHAVLRNNPTEKVEAATSLEDVSDSTAAPSRTFDSTVAASRRHIWRDDQLKEVTKIFEKNIESGKVTIEDVRVKTRNIGCLNDIPSESIRDKVRSLIKSRKNKEQQEEQCAPPTEIESQADKFRRFGLLERNVNDISFVDERSIATNTTSSLMSGRAFNEEQTEMMFNLFRRLIESNAPIERGAILSAIEEHSRARLILQGFTPLQLCDKIRTERRRLKRLGAKK